MKRIQKTATVLLAVLCVGSLSLKAQNVPAQTDTLYITLDKALEIALSENPTIKIADKEVERTNYAKKEAIGNLIPSVSGSLSYQRSLKDSPMFMSKDMIGMFQPGVNPSTLPDVISMRTSGLSNSYTAGLGISVPIFSMSLYKNIQLADINIQVALEAARESKVALKNQVELAYYIALLAENSFDVMDVSLKNAESNYENIRLKYEEGVVPEYDKISAEVQVNNVRPSFIQAKNNLLVADLQLKMLMGVPLDIVLVVEGDILDYKDDYKSDSDLYSYTLDNNTDMRKLGLQEELLRKQLQLQRTLRYPTLGAQFNYNFITQNSNFDIFHYIWYDVPTIGVSLSVPIFNGFTLKNKEKQIKATISQLQLQRDYRESSLNVEVRNALNAMLNAVEVIEANASSVSLAERAYSISKTRYDSGVGTLLEMNNSELLLTQAKLSYNSAIYSYVVAKSDYVRVLGNSF